MDTAWLFLIKVLIVVQPLSAIPMITMILNRSEAQEVSKLALKAALYFIITLFLVYSTGPVIVSSIGITEKVFTIIGGFIIIFGGLYLFFGKYRKYKGINKEQLKSFKFNSLDLAFVPILFPLFIDPIVIIIIIAFSLNEAKHMTIMNLTSVCLIMGLICFIFINYCMYICRILTLEFITLTRKITGIILAGLGVEMVIKNFIET